MSTFHDNQAWSLQWDRLDALIPPTASMYAPAPIDELPPALRVPLVLGTRVQSRTNPTTYRGTVTRIEAYGSGRAWLTLTLDTPCWGETEIALDRAELRVASI